MSPGHIGEVLSIKGCHLPNTPSGQSLHQTLISHTQLGEASCTVGQTCQVLSCAINCDQPIPSSEPQHAQAVYLVDSFLQPAPVHLQSVHLNGQLGYKFGCEKIGPLNICLLGLQPITEECLYPNIPMAQAMLAKCCG